MAGALTISGPCRHGASGSGWTGLLRTPAGHRDRVQREAGLAAAGVWLSLLGRRCWLQDCPWHGLVAVSISRLAGELGVDRKTLRRQLGELQDRRFLVLHQAPRTGPGGVTALEITSPDLGWQPLRGMARAEDLLLEPETARSSWPARLERIVQAESGEDRPKPEGEGVTESGAKRPKPEGESGEDRTALEAESGEVFPESGENCPGSEGQPVTGQRVVASQNVDLGVEDKRVEPRSARAAAHPMRGKATKLVPESAAEARQWFERTGEDRWKHLAEQLEIAEAAG